MHGPTGSSGVHAVPQSGQSAARILPHITSPQRQAVGALSSTGAMPNFRSASNAESAGASASPLPSIAPSPRHMSRRETKHSAIIRCARAFPLGDTARVYSFSSAASPAAICRSRRYTARSISSASNPAMTAGILYSSGRNAKPRAPIIEATCPGQMKPEMSNPSPAISARRDGSTVLSIDHTEKLQTPSSRAVSTAAAVPGAVVSNPMPRNTTSFSGLFLASVTASTGE